MDNDTTTGHNIGRRFPTKLELSRKVEQEKELIETMPHDKHVDALSAAGVHPVEIRKALLSEKEDAVNHPSHYTAYKGLEVIDLTEQMNFNRGNAVKYICRAGLKDKNHEVQDLEKAAWYINREIERLKSAGVHDAGLEALNAALTGVTAKGEPACTQCGCVIEKGPEGSKIQFCKNRCPATMTTPTCPVSVCGLRTIPSDTEKGWFHCPDGHGAIHVRGIVS